MKKYLKQIFYETYGAIAPISLAKYLYLKNLGRPMNLKNPSDLNEKINYLKFYSDTTQWSVLADKYLVRNYVEQKGLKDILIPVYGVYDTVEQMDFSALPQEFVIKTTHGCADAVIVRDKMAIEKSRIINEIKKNLKLRHGLSTAQPHYLKIKPRLIVEKLLTQDGPVKTHSLIDYKIWCFNGIPHCIWTCYDRSKTHVKVLTYDTAWNNISNEYSVDTEHYSIGNDIPKPDTLDRMLECASILSNGFPQVRVDMYSIGTHVYFGEMTFTSYAGYMPYFTKKALLRMGELIEL